MIAWHAHVAPAAWACERLKDKDESKKTDSPFAVHGVCVHNIQRKAGPLQEARPLQLDSHPQLFEPSDLINRNLGS